MPTQNLFILDNKKHRSELKSIDFGILQGEQVVCLENYKEMFLYKT